MMQSLELAGIALEAYSVGGIETCIHLPRHKVAFDIGKCPEQVVPREQVFFSHGHMDHMGGIAYHCSTRALRNMRPPTYIMQAPYVPKVQALLEAWRALDHSEMPAHLVSMEPGDRRDLNASLFVQAFQTYHTAPSMGFGLWSKRSKLMPEFVGLDGLQIKALREAGTKISQVLESPEMAFCGDTMIEVVERQEVVRKARLLIMECTFIDDRIDAAEARSRGHLHLDEIAERAELFENEAILLHHFSSRFSRTEITEAIEKRLPEALRSRVTPLLVGFH